MKTTHRLTLFAVPALALAFTSCMPPPVYRLTSVSANARWLQGQQIVTRTDSAAEIRLAFNHTSQSDLVFDLEVTNLGNREMLMSPELCLAHPLDKEGVPLTFKGVPIVYRARNPEEVIAAIDKRFATEQSSYITSTALDAGVSVLGLIGDIATIGQKTKEEVNERKREREQQELNRINRDVSFANSTQALQSERSVWSDMALRKTTLLPNQSIRGEIHFPTERNAELLKIVIVVESQSMEFVFRQLKL